MKVPLARLARLVAWLVVAARPACALADDRAERLVAEAVAAYRAAMEAPSEERRLEGFSRAHRLFAQAIEARQIHNADLQTNLGNAALQARRLGPAILAYRRALAIEPGHARAARNLTHARTLLPNWVPVPEQDTLVDTFLFWTRLLSVPAQTVVASAFFALGAALLAVAIRWKRRWARNLAIVPLVIWAVMTASALWHGAHGNAGDVVVTADEATGYCADSAGSPPRFGRPLPGGTEARLIAQRGGWAHVRLADGQDAWLRRAVLQPVRPEDLSPSPG